MLLCSGLKLVDPAFNPRLKKGGICRAKTGSLKNDIQQSSWIWSSARTMLMRAPRAFKVKHEDIIVVALIKDTTIDGVILSVHLVVVLRSWIRIMQMVFFLRLRFPVWSYKGKPKGKPEESLDQPLRSERMKLIVTDVLSRSRVHCRTVERHSFFVKKGSKKGGTNTMKLGSAT